MQACIYDRYGSSEVVRVAEVPAPEVGPDALRIRVGAAAVTTADWRFRSGTFPHGFQLLGRMMVGLFRPRRPILGMSFAGRVEAVGPRVTRFRPGDAVFGAAGATRRGAHAELVTVRESGVVLHKPASLSDAEAAAIPFGACSALSFVRDVARVGPGHRVLVVGASGNVGVWTVQIARHLGAEVVGVCSAANAPLVRELGAADVVDYRDRLIPAGTFDAIIDTTGATTFAMARPALAPRGVYVPIEGGVGQLVQALLHRQVKFAISQDSVAGLETILDGIAAGALRPVIDRVYPMARIADAHRHVEGRHKRGAVVLAIPAAA